MKEIAETRMRYVYRRIHVLLRREGWPVNVKRVRRLCRHDMESRGMKRPLASRPDEIWAMDFASDALFNGKRGSVI